MTLAHNLLRVEEKLCNVPHLVHPTAFEGILNYIRNREASDFQVKEKLGTEHDEMGRYAYNSDLGVAVINIEGPLTYKPITMFGMDCGGASYQSLKEDFSYLVDQGAKTIALSFDSPGGEAYQCFATGRFLRELANENGVKIISFVDRLAASAAYGLASIADEIIVAEGSEVGSIGVLVRLMNDSKRLEKEGLERTFVTAGKDKVPFAADGSFRPEFLEDIQEKVDALYTEFTSFVATNRNISIEDVIATNAKTFLPEKALELGLIDKVMTVDSFYEYLAELNTESKESGMLNKDKLFKLNKQEETLDMNLEEIQAALASAEKTNVELATQLTANLEALAAKDEAIAELQAGLASLKETAEAARLDARKQKLMTVVSDEKAVELNASLASLGDEAFASVLSGLEAAASASKASDLFNEVGTADAATTVIEPSKAGSAAADQTRKILAQTLNRK